MNQHFTSVQRDICQKEFMALKDCVQRVVSFLSDSFCFQKKSSKKVHNLFLSHLFWSVMQMKRKWWITTIDPDQLFWLTYFFGKYSFFFSITLSFSFLMTMTFFEKDIQEFPLSIIQLIPEPFLFLFLFFFFLNFLLKLSTNKSKTLAKTWKDQPTIFQPRSQYLHP